MNTYCCPAFWRAARRILRVAGSIACLAVAVFSTETCAQSPTAPGSAVQAIDAGGHSFVVDLDGPWRFHAGDDPHFADSNFDDSAWPTARPKQPRKTDGSRAIHGGFLWARIHLRLSASAGPLALAIYPDWSEQYEVFVNGSAIASTPGMATRTLRVGPVFPVSLPPAGDVVLAIRFYCGEIPSQGLPFTRASVGSSDAILAAAELDHLQSLLESGTLANSAWLFVVLALSIIAIILYRMQRDHDEYLWFGFLCLDFALYTVVGDSAIASGWVPMTLPMILLGAYSGWACLAIQVEFMVRFTRTRRRWPIRMLQGFVLIGPLLSLSPSTWRLYMLSLLAALFAVPAVEIVCLVSAFRRGMTDSGLLLISCTVMAALNLAWVAAFFFPAAVPWKPIFRFGPVGMQGNYFSSILFNLGIIAVVLYRFIRVSRDEERAAAELEAARTVQQILVPEHVPTIPGFFIDAVYQPAGQVGGDFYQVLPAPNGGLLAVIGDVSGKGMPAAMTVSLLVGTVRTLAHYTQDPAEILAAMNQRLIGRGSGFTTALVMRLDPDGALTAANAGHIAPYANGRELEIDNGLPLGITAAATYSDCTLHLEANTALTLLTDGVVEAQNAKGELFGFDLAAQISLKPAQNVAQAAQTFGQQDDITVLSLALVVG